MKKTKLITVSLCMLLITTIGTGIGATAASDWSMYRHDPGNTGASDAQCIPAGAAITTYWRTFLNMISIGDLIPIVVGTQVFLVVNNHVCCFNKDTGNKMWENTAIVSSAFSVPAVSNGKIYIAAAGNPTKLWCLNAGTGQSLWNRSVISSDKGNTPIVNSGKVYYAAMGTTASGGRLYCFNADTGADIWNRSTAKIFNKVSPAVIDGKVYITSYYENLWCFNADTGIDVWSVSITTPSSSSAVVSNSLVYLYDSQKVYCYYASNGTQKWTFTGYTTTLPVISEGKVFVRANSGTVYALNAETGVELWEKTTTYKAGIPTAASQALYLRSSTMVACLDSGTGSLNWEYTIDCANSLVGSVSVGADGSLYVVANGQISFENASLYCLGEDHAPILQSVESPEQGNVGENLAFTVVGTDNDVGDTLRYFFDWDDGNDSFWVPADRMAPGESFDISHAWSEPGDYTVRVQAMDSYGYTSAWTTVSLHINFLKFRISGGFGGITVGITNMKSPSKPGTYTDIAIELVGGTFPGFHVNKYYSEHVYIPSGNTTSVRIPVFGLGHFKIMATAECAGKPVYNETMDGRILFFFVLL